MSDDINDNVKLELLVQELQSRIGAMAMSYETQIAVANVNIKARVESYERKISELENLVRSLSTGDDLRGGV